MEEPWPLPILGKVRMSPGPEGGVGEEGGKWGEGTKETAARTVRRRGTPCGPSSHFPQRRRRKSPGLLLSSLSRRCHVKSGSGSIVQYKQINMKMIIINSLLIFITTLTGAAQCFTCRTFTSGRHNVNGCLMVDLCLLSCYPSFIIQKREICNL